MIFNVVSDYEGSKAPEIITQIIVSVSDAYEGSTISCSNESSNETKTIDSSLSVTFDVTLGEWLVKLEDLEETVDVYYYGIHRLDFSEPDSEPLVTKMSSSVGGSGTAIASSIYDDRYCEYKAFDGLYGTNNAWSSKAGMPQWYQFKFNTPKVVKRFAFWISLGAPKRLKLEGANDTNDWHNLGEYTNTVTLKDEKVEFKVKNKTPYLYYRLYFYESFGEYVELAELQFYGY